MKRDLFTMSLDLGNELIIDNFAGGGGTSTGLEQAFGRPVDIAINHDPEALAMHAANHPHTTHLCESVWDVDPIKVTGNRPVGLVWLSPDCKHFSKAKGGKPVEKRIRGLAWVTLRWAAKCKPRVIMLENVEEFKTWGPLLVEADGSAKPDPANKGKTFDSFIRQLRGHGYTVDYREMRGCDHDTPTIRKRFFLVARRDGIAIKWPEPTHGAPDSIGVRAGKLLPYRTAAECIDFSLPCPSIFERDKPLAPATLRRIAKGIMRYVVDAADPFIVNTANSKTTGRAPNVWEAAEPLRTITSAPGFSVVAPTIVPVTHQGADRTESIGEPFRTITGAHRGEKALGVATLVQVGYGERKGQAPRALDIEKPLGTVVGESKHALVSALLTGVGGRAGQSRPRGLNEPTATATSKADAALVTAVLVDAAHGEVSPGGVKRWGAGAHAVEAPLGTVTASGNKAVATAFLAKHYTGVVGSDLTDPIGTVTACDHHSLVTAFLTEHANASNQRVMSVDEPLRTICAQVKGGHFSMVSAHIQRDMGASVGHAADAPLGTVMAGGGGKSALVTSNMIKLRGTSTAAGTNEPLGTISAGGQHHAEVRAFLLSYYGTDQAPEIDGPLATVTSRDRFGLVTIHGQDYQIVDIGLRMLQPRELFRAQGFPDDYIIGDDPAQGLKLTKSAQVRMCGNSVCPPMAKALILANFAHEREIARVA
ncbi:C-5 cytosine-specific DNA methylase [Janthinobacterium sp. HH103]|uniref:DNA cytosine methyltransferase n=1 Tax=unclassified Janthinobacterium TaxID=2610881 RepID=UPI0008739673|nr:MULTISPECIES: DNA cytosine methyltransferase [unclassified Janthinobacterium]OEZ70774.1 C-5 cytosine-specific DNA methylase [Janthinobacterium sp. HH100]OEZ76351.1 C-5 cytosine-specific DNA methylase [Janthinobacterium sp. HH103]QOU72904.1 C-5 cytosine-specific DNA methylase [Janthinobacterium sp. HH102]